MPFDYDEIEIDDTTIQVHKLTGDEAGTYQTPGGVTSVSEGYYVSPTERGDVYNVYSEDQVSGFRKGTKSDSDKSQEEKEETSAEKPVKSPHLNDPRSK